MFTYKIEIIISIGVVTTGGKDLIPKGVVTVSWSWTDDEVQRQTKKWNNTLYFTESTVNILSATNVSESIKDD